MRILAVIALLALCACSTPQTPQERYFALTGAVTVAAQATEAYVDTCNKLPAADPCRSAFPKINGAVKTMLAALHQTDKVFVTKDSAYYTLSLSTAENAVNDLKKLIAQ